VILVDTSIWIDHFRAGDPQLAALLNEARVLCHPFVIGEIALGSVARRAEVLRLLARLPAATTATPDELMVFIDKRGLANTGLGLVDAALLAAALLTPGANLWSRDRNLRAAATRCGVAAPWA
jgi:predicted nucleic acid-binding protein